MYTKWLPLYIAFVIFFSASLVIMTYRKPQPVVMTDVLSTTTTLPADLILPGYSDGSTPKPHAKITIVPPVHAEEALHPQPVKVPILNYHYIRVVYDPNDQLGFQLSVTPEVFDKQMAYLKDTGFSTISPRQLYDAIFHGAQLPPKPILVTIDDGYADVFTDAKPILERHNIKATLFIPVDLVDHPLYVSSAQLHMLAQNPNITIGGHTRTHADLPHVTHAHMEDEVIQGRALLERKIGQSIDFFAYPYGAFNQSVIEAVKKAGYKLAFSTMGGDTHSEHEQYVLRRLNVNGNYSFDHFISLVNR